MATTQKVSISLESKELRWVRERARRTRVSVSSLMSEAVRRYREEEARKVAATAFLAKLAPRERATPDEMDALETSWRA